MYREPNQPDRLAQRQRAYRLFTRTVAGSLYEELGFGFADYRPAAANIQRTENTHAIISINGKPRSILGLCHLLATAGPVLRAANHIGIAMIPAPIDINGRSFSLEMLEIAYDAAVIKHEQQPRIPAITTSRYINRSEL